MVVEDGDVTAFADGVEHLLSDMAPAKRMDPKARADARNLLTPNALPTKLKTVYPWIPR